MTVTDDEPQRLDAQAVAARAERLWGHLSRPSPDTLDNDDDELDLVAEVQGGLDERRRAVWQATIPSRLLWATTGDFDHEVQQVLLEWANDPAGRNLCLFGPVGVGKSHAAVAAVRHLHQRGLSVRFLPVVELLDMLRPGGPEGTFEQLADRDVLVLDDLGTERATDWTAERLYAVINRRWLEERPTVVTTNLPPDEFETAIGPRAFSRLVGNGAVSLRLGGADRRRKR